MAVGLVVLGGVRWAAARVRPDHLQAVAMTAGGQILVGTDSALLRLNENGQWARTANVGGVRQMLVDPGSPDQIYALSEPGRILRSQDSGRTWAPVRGHGLPAAAVQAVAYDPSGPLRLVALVAGYGYYQSDLAGEMWMQLGTQQIAEVHSLAISPLDPRKVLVGTDRGILVSANQGMRFEPAGEQLPWHLQGAVNCLAVAGDRSAVLAATSHGVLRSGDGGRSWEPVGSPGLPDVAAVAFHPRESHLVVAASRSGTVTLSRDGGQTWQRLQTGR